MAKRESCLLILVKMAIMVAILLGAVVFLIVYTKEKLNEYFNRGENIVVPDFRGKHVGQAFKEKPHGIILEPGEEKSDFRVPRDYVISQDPPPGTKVKQNKVVKLTISLGSKQVAVPDLKDKNIREAGLALLNAQLREGNRAYISYGKVGKDRIITQSPLPSSNQEIQKGVDLLISLGPASLKAPLPNFLGKNFSEVKGMLLSLGLREGKLIYKKDPGHAKDQILGTRPGPYEMVGDGATVDFLISSGNEKGNATPEDLKAFEVVETQTENETPKTAKSIPPPKIMVADTPALSNEPDNDDDDVPPAPDSNATKEKGDTVPVSFSMPDGFLPKEVKFIIMSEQGRKEVYSGIHKPNDHIKVNVPKVPRGKVQIYINDVPVEERTLE